MRVGILDYRFGYYPYVRNILDIVPEVEYLPVKDIFSVLNRTSQRVNRFARQDFIPTFNLNNQFFDFDLNRVDTLHFFNGISYGKTPWISTFETILPRFDDVLPILNGGEIPGEFGKVRLYKALDALASDACKKIIALSECNAAMQRYILSLFGEYTSDIENKLVVLPPPQSLLVSRFSDKQLDVSNKIKFMFVGASFLRKGGMEILETFQKLREQYRYEIDLTIVSSLRIDHYAIKETPEDVRKAKRIVDENPDWIHHYPTLPNRDVVALMTKSHIGLLPTYADSYGYAVLEFQAAGCPMITTDIRALPETNSNEKGWLIDVPKNRFGEAMYGTKDDRRLISDAIRTGLDETIHQIFADREIIVRKAEQTIEYIRTHHNPEEYAEKLHKLYQVGMSG